MRIGVCPGSFDPVTNGHVDIFERGSRLVDKLIIAVSSNPNKNSLFSMEERVEMIRNSVKHIPNVEIDCTGGLLNEYVKSKNATIIIRGLRALSDFEYEFQRALFAKYLDDDIETVFIMTNNKYSFVSSTGIRELAKFGGKLDGLVPDDVKEKLEERFNTCLLYTSAIDKVAIRHAMGLLKDNKVLGIFAEGNRQKSGKLGRFHDGAASIALRTGVSIVPVAIIGSHNMERNKVACIIGKPIPVEKAKATPEAIQKVNDSVKSEIQRMIDSYHNNCIEETLWK